MRKFKFEFETIRYPLIIMLIMFLFRGISNTILSDLIRPLIGGNFNWLISLMEIFQYFSAFVIQYLPFIIVIKYLSSKHSRNTVTIMFIVSYILILTTTMVIGTHNMPSSAYQSLFGISQIQTNSTGINTILMPYRIGLFGAVISGLIVHYSFKMTRTRTRYALFKFIDRDLLSFIIVVIVSLLTGIAFSYIWPSFIAILMNIFEWISSDISNPTNTFVYGFFDKILSLLDLSPLNRDAFWFGSLGGSYMDASGVTHLGDVSIWNAQTAEGIFNSGFGRFLTPYYIINLFAIPGMLLGMFNLYTNKKERFSHSGTLILLFILAFVSDISLPVEFFLVFMAPLLYLIHLFISSAIFGILQALEIFLGSSFITDASNAALGNGVELLQHLNNNHLKQTIVMIVIVGIIIFIIYYFLTKLFYKHLALGLVNKFDIEVHVEEFLGIIGGIDNIETIDSNPFRIEVKLKRPQMFDYDALERTNISRVKETQSIYAIYYGTASTIIRNEILTRKKLLED